MNTTETTTPTTLAAAVLANMVDILTILATPSNKFPGSTYYRPVAVMLPTVAADVAAHRLVDRGLVDWHGRSLDCATLAINEKGLEFLAAAATAPVVEVHRGRFNDSLSYKWAVTIDGKLVKYTDGWGHQQVRTWGSEHAAATAAARILTGREEA